MPEFNTLKFPERVRRYHFVGYTVVLYDVRRIAVSKSGTHRLETGDGKKHIIPTGWFHIEFEAADWTF